MGRAAFLLFELEKVTKLSQTRAYIAFFGRSYLLNQSMTGILN